MPRRRTTGDADSRGMMLTNDVAHTLHARLSYALLDLVYTLNS